MFAIFVAARPRPRPVQAMEMKKFSGILPLQDNMYLCFVCFCHGSCTLSLSALVLIVVRNYQFISFWRAAVVSKNDCQIRKVVYFLCRLWFFVFCSFVLHSQITYCKYYFWNYTTTGSQFLFWSIYHICIYTHNTFIDYQFQANQIAVVCADHPVIAPTGLLTGLDQV